MTIEFVLFLNLIRCSIVIISEESFVRVHGKEAEMHDSVVSSVGNKKSTNFSFGERYG